MVSEDPETSHRANEAVRIALGILAGENEVAIALLGAGAKILDAEGGLRGRGGSPSPPGHAEEARAGPSTSSGAPCDPGRWNAARLELVPIDGEELADLLAGSRRALIVF